MCVLSSPALVWEPSPAMWVWSLASASVGVQSKLFLGGEVPATGVSLFFAWRAHSYLCSGRHCYVDGRTPATKMIVGIFRQCVYSLYFFFLSFGKV